MKAHLSLALALLLLAGTPARPQTETDAPAPFTLVDCLAHARANARELQRRRLTHESQQLGTRVEEARFATDLNAEASHGAEDEVSTGALGLRKELPGLATLRADLRAERDNAAETEDARLSLTLSRIVLGGGSAAEARLGVDNSLLDELVARNRLLRKERELVFEVHRAFYRIVREQQTLLVQELRMQRTRRNLEHAIERENPLDIAVAQLDVPETETGLLRARRAIETALDDLKLLIGWNVAAPFAIDPAFEYRPQAVDAAADILHSFQHDEELVNAGLEHRKLENRARVERPRVWPKVTLTAGAVQPSEDGTNLDGETDWRAGAAVAWTFGAPAERATYRRTQYDLALKDIDVEDLRQAKARTLRDLARRIEETERGVTLQEDRVRFAERRVELYADRWENGEVDILEYTRSQADLENNRIRLIETKTTYLELLAEYRFAAGR